MNAVWSSGPNDRCQLLVLLAMADMADDAGRLWPAVATIAAKSRMSERNCRRVMRDLEAAGWVETEPHHGRSNTNIYIIKADRMSGIDAIKPDTMAGYEVGKPDIMSAFAPENRTNRALKPDTAMSGEPSEPKKESIFANAHILSHVTSDPNKDDRADLWEDCIAHFNALAQGAGWPRVQRRTNPRLASLAARVHDAGGVDNWRDAIHRAAASPFLTGQNRTGWRADFDWLCTARNFTKLMEGNYDAREQTRASVNDPTLRAIVAAAGSARSA